MACLCKRPPPFFGHPWALTQENTVTARAGPHQVCAAMQNIISGAKYDHIWMAHMQAYIHVTMSY